MDRQDQFRQDDQIEEIIGQIWAICGKELPLGQTIAMIGKVIQLRENHSDDLVVRKQISGVTGVPVGDKRIDQIISEIEDRPQENTYQPFNNPFFADLKQQYEKKDQNEGH